ncbi:MAG: tellurite resistance TerB family protein [Calothrix sp. C42_A2020_038]|nr:tellurite resistance TerB family protein [Calothrix sp. C42_A2020_038]
MPRPSFSKNRSASKVALETDVANAVIGIFSAFVDEEGFSEEEAYAIAEMLAASTQFEDYSEEDLQEIVDKAIEVFDQEGAAGAMELAIASFNTNAEREMAYITALCVVAVDGEVPPSEEEYIADIQQALNISDARAEEIMDDLFTEYEEDEEDEE